MNYKNTFFILTFIISCLSIEICNDDKNYLRCNDCSDKYCQPNLIGYPLYGFSKDSVWECFCSCIHNYTKCPQKENKEIPTLDFSKVLAYEYQQAISANEIPLSHLFVLIMLYITGILSILLIFFFLKRITIDQFYKIHNLNLLIHTRNIKAATISKQLNWKQKLNPESDIKTNSDSNMCKICYDRKKRTVIWPCAHVLMCITCAKNYNNDKCPVCNTEIQEIKEIFT